MMIPSIGRLSAINTMNNAAYNWMNASNSLMGLCSFSGSQNQNLASIHRAEQRLTLNMITNSLMYKIAEIQEKSLKKLEEEDIKRSFSTFA